MKNTTFRLPALVAAFLLPAVASPAAAGFADRPYELRLALSLDRLSAFTDVTGRGGTSTAHPMPSSSNPAAGDFLRTAPFDFTAVATASANYVHTESGADVLGLSSSAVYRLPTAGAVRATYVYTDSLTGEDRTGFDQILRANEVFFAGSRRIGDSLSLGAELHLFKSSTTFPTVAPAPPPINSVTLPVDSDNTGFDLTLGAIYAPAPQWTLGLAAAAGRASADVLVDTPFGPQPADTFVDNFNVRTGVGYRPAETLGLYADLQFRHLSDDNGSIDVGRLFAAAEFSLLKWLTLRTGGSVDTYGHTSAAAGVGIYALPRVPIELAYTYDTFPEVRDELGPSHLFSVSLVLLFP